MKRRNYTYRLFLAVMCFVFYFGFVGCAREPTIEGRMEIMLEMGSISAKGIEVTMHSYVISGDVAYKLEYAQDCKVAGMDKLKDVDVGEGVAIDVGEQKLLLKPGSKYLARGSVTDTELFYNNLPIKKLKASYIELIELGPKREGVKAGFPRPLPSEGNNSE